MTTYRITGFNTHDVWVQITIRTTEECISLRAHEKGIVEITNIEKE